MIYSPIKLDRDLYVDRTKIVQPDDLLLNIPLSIKIQSSSLFEIENYNPQDVYEVTFSHGTWTRNQQYIQYNSPDDYFGPLTLTIKQSKAPFDGYVLFEDGTIYTETGEVKKAQKTTDGIWFHDYQYSDYDEDKELFKVDPILPPVPSSTYSETPKTINLGEYNPSELFGDLGSVKLDTKLSSIKDGNVSDYFLPSESNKSPDDTKYLYQVKDTQFLAVPRNSNVTESGGNMFDGYRKPGEVGGSLTVTKAEDQLDKTFQWDLEIRLWDLEAILPDDIISLCITSIEFEPVLRGLAIGHTYLWEQISGDQSTVTWLTPKDQKDVIINLGGLKVDRVFRFWISKGTVYEKYYDIYLYGTPFDRVVNAPMPGMALGSMQNHLNIKVHECGPILLSHTNIWNKQLRVNVVRNY